MHGVRPGFLSGPRRVVLRYLPLAGLAVALLFLSTACAVAPGANDPIKVDVQMGTGTNGQALSGGIQLIVLLTFLSLIPAMMMLVTSFTRIIIVLSFVRSAIGVPQLPPNQVLLGLGLFLTIFVMAPVWKDVNTRALQPYLQGGMSLDDAMTVAAEPLRRFMFTQTRQSDLELMISMSGQDQRPNTEEEVPTHVLVPAFAISELKTGFQMGFMIYIPFLVIDMIVSGALMSMGMVMLPPVVISLPFKILLFVLVDGWHLIAQSLIASFG
ncbi:MAG: flagellar biosynthesis protein FliP [Chloroflexota bacterium]|nr:MAG: flagellar biosynthesis protein FliP [Chloroflexota bacterium]